MNMDQHLIESVGWTLVHSLWQSAIIFVLLFLVTRSLGSMAAQFRYTGWTFGLGLIIASAMATFFVVYAGGPSDGVLAFIGDTGKSAIAIEPSAVKELDIAQSAREILAWIDLNLIWMFRIWLIGSVALLLRMLSGVLYISFLKGNAQAVAGNWEEKVNELARGLYIERKIIVAEGRVSTPMVIGYLKPVILFPIGMIAGLAPGQVEAILIHELAHVRRHDFVINLVQCVVESIFFFNPFVWMISSRIRQEREHCCDDLVIGRGIDPLAYVRTLAMVEGVAMEGRLALGLLGQRHQLLNRMKRIMEKSVVKKEWNGARLIPVSLVLIGLVCASWLSVGVEPEEGAPKLKQQARVTGTDTTIVRDDSRDEQKVIEEAWFSYDESFDPGFFPPADPVIAFAPFPAMPPEFTDSIPGFFYVPDGDWELFEKEFTEKFRTEFDDFFEKNKGQFEKMMGELREKHKEFDKGFIYKDMDALGHEELAVLQEKMNLLNPMMENPEHFKLFELAQEDAMRAVMLSQEALAQSDMARMHEKLAMQQESLIREQETNLRAYEEAMIEQFIKDGYLEKNEKVSDIHIKNGEVTVNGKKVKEADEHKYAEIRERFNKAWHAPRKAE